ATLPDKAEVEFGLSRAAGGVVIADQQEEKKRWSISSVDGWVLGQPGPGQEWRPARGVELTLEAREFVFQAAKIGFTELVLTNGELNR
ncbi:hypothetical protein AK812_SmicGene36010, partial [Symbiodinium microadriaticum]